MTTEWEELWNKTLQLEKDINLSHSPFEVKKSMQASIIFIKNKIQQIIGQME